VPKGASLPHVAEAQLTERWMPHARFDHDVTAASLAQAAIPARSPARTPATSSFRLSQIAKTCHAPGPDHAESRCFECHTYHDWSKRKEVRPTYLFPSLKTGGM